MAREQHEAIHPERRAREKAVLRKELHHLLARRRTQPRERDVRREFPRLGLETDALQRGLDLLLEVQQRAVGAHAGPKRPRVLAAELADTGKLKLEARSADGKQRIIDVVTDVLGDLADEAECQVELVIVGPARARHAALQSHKAVADDFGQFQRDEEADHQRAPNGRLRRKLKTTIPKAEVPNTPAMKKEISSRKPPAGPSRFWLKTSPAKNPMPAAMAAANTGSSPRLSSGVATSTARRRAR